MSCQSVYRDILVHICCSVDSHYFLSELKKRFPKSSMIGYFYNPNIHPKEEYDLRLLDVKRSCKMLGIKLLEGEYDSDKWFKDVKGLEKAPEKGERCVKCFDVRLEKAAQQAKAMSIDSFTTTLLSSPLKEQHILFAEGDEIAMRYDLDFIKIDVRSNGGTQAQSELANRDKLYKQTYCGCQFALNAQRNAHKHIPLELMSNIGKQVMPGSNEERKLVFETRDKYEEEKRQYALFKRSKVIWRNLRSMCFDNGKVIDSYVIAHSRSKNMVKTSHITYVKHSISTESFRSPVVVELGYAKHDDSVFISIDDVNLLLNTHYKNTAEMLYHPPLYEIELKLRYLLCGSDSINPIIVLDKRIKYSLKIFINAHFQEGNVFSIIAY